MRSMQIAEDKYGITDLMTYIEWVEGELPQAGGEGDKGANVKRGIRFQFCKMKRIQEIGDITTYLTYLKMTKRANFYVMCILNE